MKGCKNSMAPTATEWQHAEPAAVTPTYCTRILCIAASPRQKGGGRCASASTWENSAAHSGWQLKDTAGRIFAEPAAVTPTYCTRILCIAASPRQKGGGRCVSASTWENSAAQSGWQLKDTAGRTIGRTPGVSPPSTMGASAMASLPADVLSAAVGTDLHWQRQLLACSSDEECPWG